MTDGAAKATGGLDRRALLRNGLMTGFGAVAIGVMSPGLIGKARAATLRPNTVALASITVTGQSGWDFCDKCKGFYFGTEQSSSVCPAGGTHGGPSAVYTAWMLDSGTTTTGQQSGWDFCDKCKVMYFGTEQSSSVCPAGGTHGGPSAVYVMFTTFPPPPTNGGTQSGWKFCDKCKAMYYGNEQSSSVCPAGGTHGGNSSVYVMSFT